MSRSDVESIASALTVHSDGVAEKLAVDVPSAFTSRLQAHPTHNVKVSPRVSGLRRKELRTNRRFLR